VFSDRPEALEAAGLREEATLLLCARSKIRDGRRRDGFAIVFAAGTENSLSRARVRL
jgi:hypothetical protein